MIQTKIPAIVIPIVQISIAEVRNTAILEFSSMCFVISFHNLVYILIPHNLFLMFLSNIYCKDVMLNLYRVLTKFFVKLIRSFPSQYFFRNLCRRTHDPVSACIFKLRSVTIAI